MNHEPVEGKGLSAKPYLVSLLCHVGLIGAVIVVATLNVRDIAEVIEVEIVEMPPPVEEPVQPLPIPEPPVPDVELVERVETEVRPFHAEAEIINQLPRQADAAPRPAPTQVLAIPMEATVDGGGGFEVLAVVGADPGMRGDPNAVWLPAEEYADTWEITAEPEPINDREFRPVYPPDAKARRVEAAVEVELLVDSTGTVAETNVLTTVGDQFSLSALDYCRKLRFKPALANRVPVASRIVWVVDYRFGNR
ncbi:MAG TPA: energy transducer TonB [Candidatus Latescibacteria bacterium]|nr:hypothetical protein [Gemmatimonadaceae bacterium]MDP6015947.1 energy transducer TonB [Candidatus Latescibacterota bacterium]HJP29120.1 energy transducer TonB [Candidatus Latescibacterota bacterium]